jgi:hypothetical protein
MTMPLAKNKRQWLAQRMRNFLLIVDMSSPLSLPTRQHPTGGGLLYGSGSNLVVCGVLWRAAAQSVVKCDHDVKWSYVNRLQLFPFLANSTHITAPQWAVGSFNRLSLLTIALIVHY